MNLSWKSNLPVIAFLVIVSGGIFALYHYQTSPPKFKSPKETVCTVVSFSTGTRGADANILFNAGNVNFTSFISKHEGMAAGDKYKLVYEESDPIKHRVLLSEPVFVQGEETMTVAGRIIKVNSIGGHFVRYVYTANGIEYSRTQEYLPEEYNPKSGERYSVICWRQNPQRAIIVLREKKSNENENA